MLATVASYFSAPATAAGACSREDLAAQIAAQLLQFVNRGRDRRLPHEPDQHPGTVHGIGRSPFTGRTGISRLERLVWNLDPVRTRIVVGPIAAVACLAFLGFSRRQRCRFDRGRRDWLIPADHAGCLLGPRSEQQLPQPSDAGVLVVDQFGDVGVGFEQRPDQFEIALLKTSLLDAAQQLLPLLVIHFEDLRRRTSHGTAGIAQEQSLCRRKELASRRRPGCSKNRPMDARRACTCGLEHGFSKDHAGATGRQFGAAFVPSGSPAHSKTCS